MVPHRNLAGDLGAGPLLRIGDLRLPASVLLDTDTNYYIRHCIAHDHGDGAWRAILRATSDGPAFARDGRIR